MWPALAKVKTFRSTKSKSVGANEIHDESEGGSAEQNTIVIPYINYINESKPSCIKLRQSEEKFVRMAPSEDMYVGSVQTMAHGNVTYDWMCPFEGIFTQENTKHQSWREADDDMSSCLKPYSHVKKATQIEVYGIEKSWIRCAYTLERDITLLDMSMPNTLDFVTKKLRENENAHTIVQN